MTGQLDPDDEKVRRSARLVGMWVGVSSSVIVVSGVIILLAIAVSTSRREGEHHAGGWLAEGGDDFVIDFNLLVPLVLILGILGIALLTIVARIAARRAAIPLSDALRRQRQFVADASHELRTPLTALSSRIQVLQRRLERGEDAVDTARDLRRTADRMSDILSDMLIAAEGETFVGESADVAAAAAEAVGAMQSPAADADVHITTDLDVADAAVPTPAVTLVRALIALLDNAVAHSPAGATVMLTAKAAGARVEIRVIDQGRGIAGINPADVFERFARTPESGRGRGFGLGLSLVRDVAHRAGGSVMVESTSAAGTTFLLTLPITARRS